MRAIIIIDSGKKSNLLTTESDTHTSWQAKNLNVMVLILVFRRARSRLGSSYAAPLFRLRIFKG